MPNILSLFGHYNVRYERRFFMETLHKVALSLTVIGAVNWEAIGIFDFNIVEAIFGTDFLTRLIYSLVGIAGLINIGTLFSHIDTK